MRRATLMAFAAAAFGAAAGCGDEQETGPVPVHPVSGQVIYDGKPAEGVRVTFFPTDAPTRPRIPQSPHGRTGPDGRFTLTTYAPADGAAEGGYQVVLDWSTPAPGGEASEAGADADKLQGWYDVMHSPLAARVKAGPNDVPPFKIPKVTKPAGMSEGIPGRN